MAAETNTTTSFQPFKDQPELRAFFSSEKNAPLFYLTYPEYCRVFGFNPEKQYLSELNKRIIYGHLDYFNQSYDSLWIYKWTPLMLKFLLNIARLRPTSIVFSAAYLWAFDFFLEPFAIYKSLTTRNIHITALFDFDLNKAKYLEIRERQINRYIAILNENTISETLPEKLSVIFAGTPKQKLNRSLKKEPGMRVEINFPVRLLEKIKGIDAEMAKNFILTAPRKFINDFWEYKAEYKGLPSRKDFEGLLNSQYIKPAKTRGFFDEFQEKVDSLVFAGGYLRNPSDPKNIWEFDWKRVRREKQEKPRFLHLKNTWPDFAIFTLFLLVPAKALRFARRK